MLHSKEFIQPLSQRVTTYNLGKENSENWKTLSGYTCTPVYRNCEFKELTNYKVLFSAV